jgi:N-methylhydantoinase B/oxoprolinase/acetone carboxylase alpha subunit
MDHDEFARLADLIRRPALELPDEAVAAGIRPVNAGLFGAQGEPLLVSSVGLLPSMRGALQAVRSFFGERWAPGDVALTNDMDAGAVNACEIMVVAPVYSVARLSGWCVVRGRIPDFGGWEPGGYSPQAVDRWAEGARLEPVKAMAGGSYRREVIDLLRLNSRTPATTVVHVRVLVEASLKLGRAYGEDAVAFGRRIEALAENEVRRIAAAFEALPAVCPSREVEIAAPWSNERFGRIGVEVTKSAGGLRAKLSGPPVAARPINLGRHAAADIVTAAVASACGFDDLISCALPAHIDVALTEPSLLAAPLPATVGLGRQVTGQALFRATAAVLGMPAKWSEAQWRRYREATCGSGFDPQTGKLASSQAAEIRERQTEEVAA